MSYSCSSSASTVVRKLEMGTTSSECIALANVNEIMNMDEGINMAGHMDVDDRILSALKIVRQGADVMPRSQLNHVLDSELGSDWSRKLRSFDYEPMAAASIGQGKEQRAARILENFAEGERYSEHGLRKFVRNRAPEIMPSLNSFFAVPK